MMIVGGWLPEGSNIGPTATSENVGRLEKTKTHKKRRWGRRERKEIKYLMGENIRTKVSQGELEPTCLVSNGDLRSDESIGW
jgi:hypothetical protein